MSPLIKKILLGLAAISLVFIVCLGGLFIWFQSDSGQAKVASLVSDMASNDTMSINIGGFNGLLPLSSIDVTDINISDQAGTLMTLDTAHLSWKPFELLTGKLHITQFEIGTLDIARLPESQAVETDVEPPATESAPLTLPSIDIVIDEIKAKRIHLSEAILGESIDVSIDSRALLESSGEKLSLFLVLERIDAIAAVVRAEIDFNLATKNLRVDIKGDEPSGTMVAKALNLPESPPASFMIKGDGLLANWPVQIAANVENYVTLEGDALIQFNADQDHTVELQLALDIANLLEPKLRKLTGKQIQLKTLTHISPQWDIDIKNLDLTTPAATLAIQGTVAETGKALALNYQIMAGDPEVFTEFVPDVLWEQVSLKGTVKGSTAQPEIQSVLLIESPQAQGFSAQSTQLDLEVVATQPLEETDARLQINLQGKLIAPQGEDPVIAELAGDVITLQVQSDVDLHQQQVHLKLAEVTTAIASLTTTGLIETWGEKIALTTQGSVPDFSKLSSLAGKTLAGQLNLTMESQVDDFGKRIVTDLNIAVEQLSLDDPALDALLGKNIDITGAAEITPDGEIEISHLTLNAAQIKTTAEALILANEDLQAQWSIIVPQLAALSEALNLPLAGTLNLTGEAKGTTSDPSVEVLLTGKKLTVQEKTIKAPRIELVAHSLTSDPTGTLKAELTFDNIPAKSQLDFTLSNNETLSINDFVLSALGIDMQGDIELTLADTTANGTITGKIADFAPISKLAEQDLSGEVTFILNLSEQNQQTVNLQAQVKQLEIINNGVKQNINAVELIADIQQALQTPLIDVKLQANGIKTPDIQVDGLSYTMRGGLEDMTWDVATTAQLLSLDQPLNVQGAGTAQLTEANNQLTIASLVGQLGHIPFTLLKPLVLLSAQDKLSLQDLVLQIQEGQIKADMTMDDKGITANAIIDQLPLDLVRIADPSLVIFGSLNGDLTLGGSFTAPEATVNLRLNDVAIEQGEGDDITKLNAQFQAKWVDELAELTGKISQKGGVALDITATAPLVMTQEPTSIQVPPQLPLKANVIGQVDLNLVNAFLAGSGNQLNGQLELNANVKGSIENLDFLAEVKISEGKFENLQLGTLINDIELHVLASPEQVMLKHLKGTTPKNGKLMVEGRVDLVANGSAITDISVKMDKAQLVAIDMLTTQVSSDITLSGPLNDAWLKGLVQINKADFYIPNKLPPSVVTLEVEEKGGEAEATSPEQVADKPADSSAPPPVKISLDINILAKNQIFIRGNGMDAEFEGDMKVTGTADDPKVDGSLEMRKGILDAFRSTFEFQKGVVNFDNVPTNQPQLDFLTKVDAKEITAIITVNGAASQPIIQLSSEPEIPQDEILARIMFGKNVSEMTPIEMAQLAVSAAQLAGVGGGGPGVMDKIRGSLGLDTLKVGSGEDGPDVEAGRYVSEGVYVGVKQGLLPGSSSAIVQVDVAPNIKVESNVSAESSRVGVNMEWDY